MGRFSNFMPELVDVVRRFPVAVVCCVWAFVLNVYNPTFFGRGLGEPETLGLTAGFLASGAAHLFAESRKWAFLPSLILAAVAAAVAGLLAYDPALLQSHRLFLFLGLVMLLFVSPYLRRGVEQGAVWLFGLRLSLAALLALVVGLTLMLGLYAVVSGLKFLFGIDLDNSSWQHISALSIYLVGPLFGLSMLPRNLNEVINLADHKGGALERGVSILVNYIKVPLAFIYALLLHAYAIKIISQQSMPKGEVGIVVTLFAVAGTLSWLLAWPFRDSGTRLLKLYSRFWFWFLPVPVVLLALATWQRIGEHGMTPDRFGLVLVALWAGLVCVYLIMRRSFADMRVVIGAAAVLLLLGSFGPFGAVSTTVKSQIVRFEKFLTDNAMLENGKLKTVLPLLGQEAKRQGHSMLQVLAETQSVAMISAFLPEGETLKNPDQSYVSEELRKRFGVNDYWQDAASVSFNTSDAPLSFPITADGRIVGPFHFRSWTLTQKVVEGLPQYKKQGDAIAMTWSRGISGASTSITFNQSSILSKIKNLPPLAVGQFTVPLIFELSSKQSMIIVESSGLFSEDKAELSSLQFWVIEKN